jgi:Right handed beta helix region
MANRIERSSGNGSARLGQRRLWAGSVIVLAGMFTLIPPGDTTGADLDSSDSPVAHGEGAVRLPAGAELQAIVDAYPPGTTFVIGKGVHVMQSITPRDGDTFIGEKGAILRGSMVLSGEWVPAGGGRWMYTRDVEEEPDPYPTHGGTGSDEGVLFAIGSRCLVENNKVMYCVPNEDLYITDAQGNVVRVLTPKLSETDVIPGDDHVSWYLRDLEPVDWEHPGDDLAYVSQRKGKIIIDIDPKKLPAGQRIEMGMTRYALGSPCETRKRCNNDEFLREQAHNVTVKNVIVERYPTRYQGGAIGAFLPGQGWVIEGNEVRYNHAAGIYFGSEATVRRNYAHHNGHVGIKGGGDWNRDDCSVDPPVGRCIINKNALVELNVISHNYLPEIGFAQDDEAGGTKFSFTEGLIVRNNRVEDNLGVGLWTDIDNVQTLYEGNTVLNNTLEGIFHEISFDAIIRRNIVRGNGEGHIVQGQPYHGAQIFISTASNARVCGNMISSANVAGSPGDSRGVIVFETTRKQKSQLPGQKEEFIATGNYIHDNHVTIGRDYTGRSGIYSTSDPNVSEPITLTDADRLRCLSDPVRRGHYPTFDLVGAKGNLFDYNSYVKFNSSLQDSEPEWLLNAESVSSSCAVKGDVEGVVKPCKHVDLAGFRARGHEQNGTAVVVLTGDSKLHMFSPR